MSFRFIINWHNKCVDAEKPAVHGSCLRNTRARLVFPVTTGVKLMKAGKKAGRKRQKRRVGLVAFGRVPENFMARGLDDRTKGKPRASRFLACYENE